MFWGWHGIYKDCTDSNMYRYVRACRLAALSTTTSGWSSVGSVTRHAPHDPHSMCKSHSVTFADTVTNYATILHYRPMILHLLRSTTFYPAVARSMQLRPRRSAATGSLSSAQTNRNSIAAQVRSSSQQKRSARERCNRERPETHSLPRHLHIVLPGIPELIIGHNRRR